jgi:hypothetical protein
VSAPIAALAYFAVYGFHPGLSTVDHIVLTTVVLAWLGYSLRVVAVARVHAEL